MLHHALPWIGLGVSLHLALTANVIRRRRRHRVSMGTGQDPALARAVRAHGNCSEYLPLGLVVLVAMELAGLAPWFVHLWGAAFVASRAVHAAGFVRDDLALVPRQIGMIGTLGALAVGAAALLGSFVLGSGV